MQRFRERYRCIFTFTFIIYLAHKVFPAVSMNLLRRFEILHFTFF